MNPHSLFMQRLNWTAALTLMLAAASPAWAVKDVRYKDYPLELKEGDRLVVQGWRGNVRLLPLAPGHQAVLHAHKTASDKSAEAQARFDQLSFAVRRDGTTVYIEAKGFEQKTTASQWLKPGTPELNLEIEAPQIPVEILMHEGQISAQNWRQALAVNVVTGAIKANGIEGSMKFSIQRGELHLEKSHGRAEIDSYAARVNVGEHEGDLDLTNFAGDTSLNSVHGNIDLRAQAGPAAITKSSGAIDFQNGHGVLNLTGFEGPVRGQTDQGAVIAGVDGEAEVHIESNQGAVTVKLPSDSGAQVRLQTDEGSFQVPESLHPASQKPKLLTGHLAGTGPKGNIAVKSKSAVVRIRL